MSLRANVNKVGIGTWNVVVWRLNTTDPTVVRGAITKETYPVFVQKVVDAFGNLAEGFDLNHLWAVKPDTLSYEIPGIGNPCIHPVTNQKGSIMNTIMDLNDCHKWTREQIADWLETLDNQPVFNQEGVLSNGNQAGDNLF